MTITLSVLTFRRPEDLRAVLPMLVAQAREVATPAEPVEVLVVDNDPEGSGRVVLDELASPLVRYVVESIPGIAAARNRALEEGLASSALVFVDDDERPHPGWLRALVDTWTRTGAVAVSGAVVSDFAADLDPWVREGGFFERRRLATDTPISIAATNNLLLDMAAIRATGLRFDTEFGLSGGSDTLFTRRLAATGALMVWCDEAVVTDHVPASRMSRDWVLRRSFRYGNSGSRVELSLADSVAERWTARARCVARGLPRVVVGGARWLLGTMTGSARNRARGLRTAVRGAGVLVGASGYVYQEYGRARRS